MPIQVWLDDSGGDNQVFQVIAGLIGQAEEWARFSDLWSACLGQSPAISYFKMREAAGSTGQFYGFSDGERDAKVRGLAQIINQFGFQAVHATIDSVAFADTIKKHSHLTPMTMPYWHAFNYVVYAVCRELLDRGEKVPCELIFDDTPFRERVKAWYPMVRIVLDDQERAVLPLEPLFRDDLTFVPLQAADMIAWSCRRDTASMNTEAEWHCFGWLGKELSNMTVSKFSDYVDRARMDEIVRKSNLAPAPLAGMTAEAYEELMELCNRNWGKRR